MQTNYADTILNITVTGSLIRIDLGTLNPVKGESENLEQRPNVTQHLVMPIEGFARSFGIQEQVINQLVKDGVLKKQPESNALSDG